MWISNAALAAVAVIATTVLSPAQAADNYAMGVCRIAKESFGSELMPTVDGSSYLVRYHSDDPRYKGFYFDSDGSTVTIVKAPKHGKVVPEEGPWSSKTNYQYQANAGYLGRDRFVMLLEKNGVKIRLHYLIEVIGDGEPKSIIGDDGERHSLWCNPESWRISSNLHARDNPSLKRPLMLRG